MVEKLVLTPEMEEVLDDHVQEQGLDKKVVLARAAELLDKLQSQPDRESQGDNNE